MNQTQNSSGAMVSHQGTSEGVIKLRLDTAQIKTDMELFLRGKQMVPVYDHETGETNIQIKDIGKPLMNEEGIQCMLMTLTNTINAHGVQGNWKSDYFENFIAEVDENISVDVWVNMNKWEVALENYNVICNAFMNLLQQYASRIIDNKERESYGASMKTQESVLQSGQRGGLFAR